jgi:hypothetical protein
MVGAPVTSHHTKSSIAGSFHFFHIMGQMIDVPMYQLFCAVDLRHTMCPFVLLSAKSLPFLPKLWALSCCQKPSQGADDTYFNANKIPNQPLFPFVTAQPW